MFSEFSLELTQAVPELFLAICKSSSEKLLNDVRSQSLQNLIDVLIVMDV